MKHWNATTRLFDDCDDNRANDRDYYHGIAPKQLKYSIHNEYFSLAHPDDLGERPARPTLCGHVHR